MAARRPLLRPVGPLPPEVYWRRRAALLLGVVVVAVLVAVLAGGGSGAPARAPRHTAAAPVVTPSAAASSPLSPSSLTTPGSPCAPGRLTVTANPDAHSYPSGVDPRFLIAVANAGPACRLPEPPAAVVTSGSDRLWSSADCAGGSPPASLAAGRQTLTVVWTRHRSEPGCASPPAGSDPTPGTYHVTVTVDGVVATAVFILS